MKDLKGCFIFLALAALAAVILGFLIMRNYGDRKVYPIKITDMSTSAQPWIGRVVTLRVKVKTTQPAPYTDLTIVLPAGVKLVAGDLVWRGALAANKTMTNEISVCTLAGGDWRIVAQARTWQYEDYTDLTNIEEEVIHFNSTKISPDGFCP
jgi:hypothetical protein